MAILSPVDHARACARARLIADKVKVDPSKQTATYQGTNQQHKLHLVDGLMVCDCDHYTAKGYCAHAIAAERLI